MAATVYSHFEHLVNYKNKSYFLVVPSKSVDTTDVSYVATEDTSIYLIDDTSGNFNSSQLELDEYTGIITIGDNPTTIQDYSAVVKNITDYLQTIDDGGSHIQTTLQNLEEDATDAGFDVELPIDDYVFRTKIAPKLLDSNYIYSAAATTTLNNIIAVNIDKITPSSDSYVIAVKIKAAASGGSKNFLDTDDSTTHSSADSSTLYHEIENISSGTGNALNSFTHMIVVKNLNDNLLDYTLSSSSINTNIALNQNTALKYILTMLIVISLINMSINYDTINISHLIVFVLFMIYYYYYDYFASNLLLKFKDAINKSKTVNTTNQITSYLRMLLLCCTSLFFPIIVFVIFNTDSFKNGITDTRVNEAVESATSSATSSFNSIKDMADDGFEQATSAASNLRNINVDDARESFKNAAGSALQDGRDAVDYVS